MTASGERVRLSSLRGRRVVLYFYPAANTPGCTREAREFTASYPDLKSKGVEVVGVSVDDVSAQRRFRDRCQVPFPLIADDGTITRRYGVDGFFGRARRITFLLDPDGRVERIVEGIRPGPHVAGAREWFAGR